MSKGSRNMQSPEAMTRLSKTMRVEIVHELEYFLQTKQIQETSIISVNNTAKERKYRCPQ